MYFYSKEHYIRLTESCDERMRRRVDQRWRRVRLLYICALLALFAFMFGVELSGRVYDIVMYKSPLFMQGCMCNEENFCFKGLNESNAQLFGAPFDCAHYNALHDWLLLENPPPSVPLPLERIRADGPAVVTAASSVDLRFLRSFVGNLREQRADLTVIIYDLGFSTEEGWCNVAVEALTTGSPLGIPMSMDPEITMASVLLDAWTKFEAFVYLDVRARLSVEAIFETIRPDVPFHVFGNGLRKAADPNSLPDYFPIPKRLADQIPQRSAAITIGSASSPKTKSAVKWLFLCAKTPNCLSGNTPNLIGRTLQHHQFSTNTSNAHLLAARAAIPDAGLHDEAHMIGVYLADEATAVDEAALKCQPKMRR